MREHHEIVVIGGGQAGLAMSAVLQQRGVEHVVLERQRVGERWRTERWESLRFQFPNWALELPGYAYSGDDPDGFAHWREILRVIEAYAASKQTPVREHTEVTKLRAGDCGFVLSVPDGTIHARQVVIATGPFQRPRIPQFSEDVAPSILQTDPTRYRRPEDLPDGAVLVVGSGASGCQIAGGAEASGRRRHPALLTAQGAIVLRPLRMAVLLTRRGSGESARVPCRSLQAEAAACVRAGGCPQVRAPSALCNIGPDARDRASGRCSWS